jgi:glycosyltransferase involved in cell wall biosynthesis
MFTQEALPDNIDNDKAPQLLGHLTTLLSARQPEAVAIPGWSHRGALAALLWCSWSGIPVVLMSETTRYDDVRRGWKESIKRRIVSLCGSALVGGKRHLAYLEELGMSRPHILLGYDVIDNDHFAKRAERARRRALEERQRLGMPERYFLASARFVERKNLPRLLKAFAGYRQAAGKGAWDLVLLGDGPLRQRLIDLLSQYGLSDVVQMAGFRQYEDLPTYYGLAGAFVHAGMIEPWGLVVNEAMAAGLPVIVSRTCGCVDELVVSGRNGFTFDPLQTSELTRLLLYVASESCERQRMASEGRAIIAEWAPDRFATGLSQAVELAIAAPRHAAVADRLLVRALVKARAYREREPDLA